MWVHHVGNWECRLKLRHPKRFFGWRESWINSQMIYVQCKLRKERAGGEALLILGHCQRYNFHLRRNWYASAHFTKRFPGHAFCCAQRKSTDTNMINNSFASTWRGWQAYHKSRQARREEKEMERERKKKMWVHLVCNWECRRGLRHPKQCFEKESLSFKHVKRRENTEERSKLGLRDQFVKIELSP